MSDDLAITGERGEIRMDMEALIDMEPDVLAALQERLMNHAREVGAVVETYRDDLRFQMVIQWRPSDREVHA